MRLKTSVLLVAFLTSALLVGTAQGAKKYKFYWTGADAADNAFTTPGNWDHLGPWGDFVSPSTFYPRFHIKSVDSGDPRDDNYDKTEAYVYAYPGASIDFAGFGDLPDVDGKFRDKIKRSYIGTKGAGGGAPAMLNISDGNFLTMDKFYVGDGEPGDGADGIVTVTGDGRITAWRTHPTQGGITLGQNGYKGTLNMGGNSTSELRSIRLGPDGSAGEVHLYDSTVCTVGVYWSMPQVETVFYFGGVDCFIEMSDKATLVARGDRVDELQSYIDFGLLRLNNGLGLQIEYVEDNGGEINPDFGYPTGWTWVRIVQAVSLDILPSDDLNEYTVNLKSKGRLPMAILGSEECDVTQIDGDTLSIGGMVFPVKTPNISDENGDGMDDLVIHVSRRDLISAMGLDALDPGTEVPVTVTGALLDGTPIEGTDTITLLARD